VVFTPAPSASTVVPVSVPTSAPVSVLITAPPAVDPSAPPSVAPPSTPGSVVSVEPPPQNVESPAASSRVHDHLCLVPIMDWIMLAVLLPPVMLKKFTF
jgi:hypothetical protein